MTALDVYINEGFLPMVDGALVYHRGFGSRPTGAADPSPSLTLSPHVFTADGALVRSRTHPLGAVAPPEGRPAPMFTDPAHPGEYLVRRKYWASYFPERTLIAESGSVISLRIHNNLAQEHELMFVGTAQDGGHRGTGKIRPGGSAVLECEAPAPGTYIFCDPGSRPDNPAKDPVERTLGLAGALLVTNTADPWVHVPGGTEFERQWLWILHDVDPAWARIASRGERVNPAQTPAYPRYFTLNGRSGFQSLGISTDEAANQVRHEESLMSGSPRHVDVRNFSQGVTAGAGRTGQLMRFVNTGIVHHQLHFHGNHVWALGRNGTQFPRSGGFVDSAGHVILQQWEDVVEMHPLDRKDSVLPVWRPPDSIDPVWAARTVDWHYPMHCHAEPSQVAAGGMYPGGLVGDWMVAAPSRVPPPPAAEGQTP
ncbi:MAG: Tat pathway signal protein [Cryobacterium sp.]